MSGWVCDKKYQYTLFWLYVVFELQTTLGVEYKSKVSSSSSPDPNYYVNSQTGTHLV